MTDRTGGISIVVGEEILAMDEEEIGKGGSVGRSDLLRDGVCSGSQRVVCLMERGWVVHPGVVMLEGKVVGDEGQEDRVTVEVSEGELMFDKWVYEREERIEE